MTRLPLIALLTVVFATGVSGCCGECGQVTDIVGAGAKLATKMYSAPGTDQMREVGCEQAIAITPEMIKEFIASMPEEQKQQDEMAQIPYPFAQCIMKKNSKEEPPSCEDVAKAYAKGSGGNFEKVGVTVSQQGNDKPICSGAFNAQGEQLGEISEAVQSTVEDIETGK